MKRNDRKKGIAYGAAHLFSLVVLGVLAVPFAVFFGLLWAAAGISDKVLDRLDETNEKGGHCEKSA